MNSDNNQNHNIAIVTGASRGIGLAISKKLISLGYFVKGICKNPDRCEFSHSQFVLDRVDLNDTKQMEDWLKNFPDKDKVRILVHNAGVGYFAPFEELSWEQIIEMIGLHLTAPMLISNYFLRTLKANEGRIFFIGSISGTKVSPWGSVYGSTKAGLIHFGRELFQELRKSGVKVTNLIPDLTNTDFFDHLSFTTDEDTRSYILPECIADAVGTVLSQREGTVLSELVIQPERFKIKKKEKGKD
ncbi:SDR family oxidoreductase [Leptospira ilyithenensis]|uniref:SDR family oxidoreductase n=1 Tax=Leptospira ilyithenensis TaxID=2484901 RepID=A0A4R9LNV1_9LEPT|nr:SDR family oxidoreductase [Leptospira ilyithenensis]TGN06911.1 SDR family oxidoreductase [Leptospira ilyithenensis]